MTYDREVDADETLQCPKCNMERISQCDCDGCECLIESCSWGVVCDKPDPEDYDVVPLTAKGR